MVCACTLEARKLTLSACKASLSRRCLAELCSLCTALSDASAESPPLPKPLTGTISKPQLNLQNLVQSQLQEQIIKGLEDLLKKR